MAHEDEYHGAMITQEAYRGLLEAQGFEAVKVEDRSDWYRRVVREEYEEYEAIKGPFYQRIKALMGQEHGDHFVRNWEAMTGVCGSGEMRQACSHGRKPA